MTDQRYRAYRGAVVAAAVAVALWRLAAYRWPSSMVTIPDGLRLPITVLGLLFMVCGLAAWWLRPDRFTTVFLLYGLGGAIHWGGPVGAPGSGAELSLLLVYLACSVLAEAALLHLALTYPHGAELGRGWRFALYLPAALALVLAPIAGAIPVEPIIGVLLLAANLFGVVAGVIFIIRLFLVDPALRRAARLPLIAFGVLAGGLLSLLGSEGLLGGKPEAWNLALALLPICLAVALITRGPLSSPAERIESEFGEVEEEPG